MAKMGNRGLIPFAPPPAPPPNVERELGFIHYLLLILTDWKAAAAKSEDVEEAEVGEEERPPMPGRSDATEHVPLGGRDNSVVELDLIIFIRGAR